MTAPRTIDGDLRGSSIAPSAIAVTFGAVGLAWSTIEVALVGAAPSAWIAAAGVGAAWSLVHGLVWAAAIHVASRLGPRRSWWIHAAVGVGLALWLAASLGAWQRLGTRNQGLALVVLAASIAVGVAGAIALRLFTPPQATGARWDRSTWSPRRRAALAAVLLAGAVIAAWIDRNAFVGLHPSAHSCLRAATLAALALAWLATRPLRLDGWRESAALGGLVVASAIGFAALGERGGIEETIRVLVARAPSDEALGSLRRLTDLDGDGFSGWLGGGDCAPFDAEVNPAATELPHNGVDDDCIGGDAEATVVDPEATPRATTPAPRSVLLVTVETLRADHLSLYGYGRPTTPHLERRSRDARVFDRAFTAGAWTSIAIPALLRGVYPRRLSWVPYAETNRGRLIAADESPVLAPGEQGIQTFMLPGPSVPPLPWWLARRGMATAAIVDDRFSELLDPALGTGAGFETFIDGDEVPGRDPDDRIADLALATIAALPDDRAAFVWVHLFGPHSPNSHHDGTVEFGPSLVDGYDHEIAFVDAQIDRLIEGIVAHDPRAVWIVTADHGEVLLEHDRMHGFDLVPEVITVPLVIGGTDWPAGRDDRVTSTVDLVPTILALTETPAPSWLDGRDLAAAPTDDRIVLVDTWHRRFDGGLLFDHAGAIDGATTLVLDITRNAWAAGPLFGAGEPSPAALARLRGALLDYLAAPSLAVAAP